MIDQYTMDNDLDKDGNPTGGSVKGKGLEIHWQRGPLGRHVQGCQPEVEAEEKLAVDAEGCTRKQPNGAFVETVIDCAIKRLEFYQGSKFACDENAYAINYLREAGRWLEARTKRREKLGFEGTNNGR